MTGRLSGVVALVQDAEMADRIDEIARDVLQNPPYVREPGLLERLVGWLAERFVGVGAGTVEVTARIIGGIIWVALGAGLLAIAWMVARRVGLGAFRRAGVAATATTVVGAPDRSVDDWLAEARRAQRDGRHRDAVRAAYRAVVAHLVERDAVPSLPGATVGAHRSALRRGQVVAELQARGFDQASEVFERVWYADAPADEGDVDVVLSAAELLELGAGTRR